MDRISTRRARGAGVGVRLGAGVNVNVGGRVGVNVSVGVDVGNGVGVAKTLGAWQARRKRKKMMRRDRFRRFLNHKQGFGMGNGPLVLQA